MFGLFNSFLGHHHGHLSLEIANIQQNFLDSDGSGPTWHDELRLADHATCFGINLVDVALLVLTAAISTGQVASLEAGRAAGLR